MDTLQGILRSSLKPKEKQVKLSAFVCDGTIPVAALIGFFQTASDADKGVCADVMKHVSEEKPELLAPYLHILVEYITYKTPRVKWGIPEAIGNMARQFPDDVVEAIPKLLLNTRDGSTVVRWCAAYALTEIALHNTKQQKELLAEFSKIVKREQNNGVKNVYQKTLKKLHQ